jgi:hypothetical protein
MSREEDGWMRPVGELTWAGAAPMGPFEPRGLGSKTADRSVSIILQRHDST